MAWKHKVVTETSSEFSVRLLRYFSIEQDSNFFQIFLFKEAGLNISLLMFGYSICAFTLMSNHSGVFIVNFHWKYLGKSRSTPWLLMPWQCKEPGHQQPWYWLCRIQGSSFSVRKNFNYLLHKGLLICLVSVQSQVRTPVAKAGDELLKSSRCLGADMVMKLLGNYCRNQDIRSAITVGVVGGYMYFRAKHSMLTKSICTISGFSCVWIYTGTSCCQTMTTNDFDYV